MLRFLLILAVRAYRCALSPLLGALFAPLGFGCRFTPTCSQYALDALQRHGAFKGTALSTRRLCRCHPWGGSGHDPVPLGVNESQDLKLGVPVTSSHGS